MGRVLIIGGTGFLGLNLARGLRLRGQDVAVTGTRRLAVPIDGLALHPHRLTDHEAISDLIADFNPVMVIHMASTLKPGSTDAQYQVEQAEILAPTARLIDLLSKSRVPFVFISSGGTVYGRTEKERLSEDDPCSPISLYGQSKLEIERHILASHAATGFPYIIVRPSNPYGPLQPLDGGQGLISTIFARLQRDQPLEIWGDGSAVRDYMHVDDFVSALCGILVRPPWVGTINVGSGVGHTTLQVIAAVEEITGRTVPIAFRPPRGVDVPRVVLDVSRLKAMNASFDRPLAKGIESYARHLGFL